MLAILIGGLFTFLFGGLILILFCGARRIEEEIEARRREEEDVRMQAARVPRFFVVAPPASPHRLGSTIGRRRESLSASSSRVSARTVTWPSLRPGDASLP